MKKIDLTKVVEGLDRAEAKKASNTIFSGDCESITEDELSTMVLLPCSNEYGEFFIAFDKEYNPFKIRVIHNPKYLGEKQISYNICPLTLKGLNLMLKDLIGDLTESRKELLNACYNNFLDDAGISADCQDLGALSVYYPHLNHSNILNFEPEDGVKVWLTFRYDDGFYHLKKITIKNARVPVGNNDKSEESKTKRSLKFNIL